MNQKRILQLLRFRWLRKAFVGKLRFKWDTEYATGVWDYLGAPRQLNYNTLLGFLQKFGHQGAILEVGCGEGILQQRMPVGAYSKYLGIDVSRIAIKKAARGNNETTEYRQGDMERFIPPGKYDLIIFNEVLHYSDNPVGLLKRYSAFLLPGGLLITSLRETTLSLNIVACLENEFDIIDKKAPDDQNRRWHCHIFRPKASPANR